MINNKKLPPQPKGTYPPPTDLTKYFGLVHQWALKYYNSSLELEELVNEGKKGLVTALKSYNGSTKYSSWASYHIRKHINLFVKKQYKIIHNECSCTWAENEYVEFVDESAERNIWNVIYNKDLSEICRRARLTKREKFVLFSHWGINTEKKTHIEIGRIINKSYEWSRQLELRAMKKIKAYLVGNDSFGSNLK